MPYSDPELKKECDQRSHQRPEYKEVMAKWAREHRDQMNANQAKYRADHLEECREASRKWARENRERLRRDKWLQRYGVTAEWYDATLEAQHGGCAICGTKQPSKNERVRYFSVDHDHETGQPRGLLCAAHNLMLGLVSDQPELLEVAAAYLRKFK